MFRANEWNAANLPKAMLTNRITGGCSPAIDAHHHPLQGCLREDPVPAVSTSLECSSYMSTTPRFSYLGVSELLHSNDSIAEHDNIHSTCSNACVAGEDRRQIDRYNLAIAHRHSRGSGDAVSNSRAQRRSCTKLSY